MRVGSVATGAIRTLGPSYYFVARLFAGTTIDGTGGYTAPGLLGFVSAGAKKKAARKKGGTGGAGHPDDALADWTDGGTGFLGLRLDAGAGAFNYGWAQLTYEGVDQLTLHDFALETSANTGINTTVIPEPSSFGVHAGLYLLAMGAAGVHALRRRRKSASEDASEPADS